MDPVSEIIVNKCEAEADKRIVVIYLMSMSKYDTRHQDGDDGMEEG